MFVHAENFQHTPTYCLNVRYKLDVCKKVSEYDQEKSEYGQVSMIRNYHNPILQTNPRHRKEEPQTINSNNAPARQQWQSNHLSLPLKDYCKT